MPTTQNRFVRVEGGFERPTTGIGSTAETNRLLGGEYFDENTGEQIRNFTPSAATTTSSTPGTPLAPQRQPAGDPFDNFNLILGEMLKGAQGISTADILKKKRALERGVIGRTSEITPEEDRTLSPSQQSAIRSGKTSALRPEIDANAYELEKAEQSIDNFFKVFGEAKKLGQEWSEKVVAPDSVIANAVKVIEAKPDVMSTVLAGFNDKTKEKILGSLDYTKLTSKSDQKIVSIDGKNYIQNADGSFTAPDVPEIPSEQSIYKQERDVRNLNSVDELIKRVDDNPGIFGRSAALPIPDWMRTDDFRNFEAELDTLKANISFGELTAMREASKTGGALGNVSNIELALLEAALGALRMDQSPENFKKQLTKIKESIQRFQKALQENQGGGETKEVNGVKYKKVPGGWQKISFNSGGAGTNRPQRNNNPGNIKKGGIADGLAVGTDNQGHLVFPDVATGFKAMEMDLRAKISGRSRYLPANPTIAQLGKVYAEDPNWPISVARILGVSPQTATSTIPFQSLVKAIAQQEGFNA